MGIVSHLDSQSLFVTRKLLSRHAPELAPLLDKCETDDLLVDQVSVELELETINQIIDRLVCIGQDWLETSDFEHHEERKQILAYVLQQWVKVGEDATRLTNYSTDTPMH